MSQEGAPQNESKEEFKTNVANRVRGLNNMIQFVARKNAEGDIAYKIEKEDLSEEGRVEQVRRLQELEVNIRETVSLLEQLKK